MSHYIQILHQQTRGGGGLEKTKANIVFALECLDQLDEIR